MQEAAKSFEDADVKQPAGSVRRTGGLGLGSVLALNTRLIPLRPNSNTYTPKVKYLFRIYTESGPAYDLGTQRSIFIAIHCGPYITFLFS